MPLLIICNVHVVDTIHSYCNHENYPGTQGVRADIKYTSLLFTN